MLIDLGSIPAGCDHMAEEEALEAESATAGREAVSLVAAYLLSLPLDAHCNAKGYNQECDLVVFLVHR